MITPTRRAVTAWVSSGVIRSAVLEPGSNSVSIGNITNSNVSGSQIPGLALTQSGSVVAVWRSSLQSSGTNGSIRSATLSPGGTTWSPAPGSPSVEVGLDAFQGGSASVATDTAGRLICAWSIKSGPGLKSAISTDGGATWGSSQALDPVQSSGIWPVTLAPLANGEVIAAGMTNVGEIKTFRLLASQSSWTFFGTAAKDGQVNTSSIVGAQPDGTAVLVYRASSGSVKAKKLPPGSQAWAGLPDLGTGSAGSVSPGVALNPVTGAMTPRGLMLVLVHTTRRTSGWVLPHGPNRVPGDVGSKDQPGMAVDPVDGSALAVWFTTSSGVKAARSNAPPGPPSPGSTPTMTSRSTTSEQIAWLAAQNGGSAITNYELEISTSAAGPWTANPTGCTSLGTSLTCNATNLTAATDYYYRVRAVNSAGVGEYSAVGGPFRTLGAPAVTTSSATSVLGTSATLNASVRANGLSTTPTFTYGTDSSLTDGTTTVNGSPTPQTTDSPVATSASISGLVPATTYYFRVDATNSEGSVAGSILSFTTPATVPVVSNSPATSVANSAARLNGTINASGSDATGTFTWGTSPTLASGNQVAAATPTPATGTSVTTVSADLSGLVPGTTYYYRLSASNGVGAQDAPTIATFTTAAGSASASTVAASSLSSTTATLNSAVSPQGSSLTVSFDLAENAGMSSPTSISATPGTVSGANPANPTAAATGLQQARPTTSELSQHRVEGRPSRVTFCRSRLLQRHQVLRLRAQVELPLLRAPSMARW